jgi:hypothetical protein
MKSARAPVINIVFTVVFSVFSISDRFDNVRTLAAIPETNLHTALFTLSRGRALSLFGTLTSAESKQPLSGLNDTPLLGPYPAAQREVDSNPTILV